MHVDIVSLDIFDKDGVHHSKSAWDSSRPNSDVETSSVLVVDAPVNEMPSVVLDITSSIIIREIIASTKEYSMWASTSRVNEVWDFTIDPSLPKEARDVADECRYRMKKLKSEGVPQDKFRLMLPLSSSTKYRVRLPIRSIEILSQFFYEMSYLNDLTSTMFNLAGGLFSDVCEKVGIQKSYPSIDYLGDGIRSGFESHSTRIGSFIHVRHKAPFSLRTHLVRHRSVHIKDNLKEWISDGIHKKTLSMNMEFEAMAPIDVWSTVSKKRSCWMAQPSLWAPFLKTLSESMTWAPALPCDDGECPFERDAMNRVEGSDPGTPCPKFSKMNSFEISENQKFAIEDDIDSNNRPIFWRGYL